MFITILGPTASGKTRLAAHLAAKMNAEIISADSRQVYRQMDIGTGKDLEDYKVDGLQIPVHLVDIADPGYQYNVFEYQNDFLQVYNQLLSQNKNMILCGGSGMYIEAVLKGYKLIKVPVNKSLRLELETKSDKELITILARLKKLHNTSDIDTRKRLIRAIEIGAYYKKHHVQDNFPAITSSVFGTRIFRDERRERITVRLQKRLESGLIEEVQALLNSGLTINQLKYYGLEYKFIAAYLAGEISYKDMFSQLNTAIHQFAKRQMTWFRKMGKEGFKINWIDVNRPVEEQVDEIMEQLNDTE